MSDSDSDSYEVVVESRFPPPAHLPSLHHGSNVYRTPSRDVTSSTRLPIGIIDTRSPTSSIDLRPPMPAPKDPSFVPPSPMRMHSDSAATTCSTYDRISTLSQSPPPPPVIMRQMSAGIPIEAVTPPPLPPMNPNRRPPHQRTLSDSSEHSLFQSSSSSSGSSGNNFLGRPQHSQHYATPSSCSSSGKSSSADGSWKLSSLSSNSMPSCSPSGESVGSSSVGSSSVLAGERYVRDSESMTLTQFIERHKKTLPVQVTVTKGYYGACERTSISDGDTFSIHFFKQTKVVNIQDSNGYRYTVPLNSALQFGLVYQFPKEFKRPSDTKYHFRTVADIIQLKLLPKAMRATRAYRGPAPDHSVEENDLLIIQEVKQKRGLRTTRTLKCTHAATGAKRSLHEDCAGYFSVSPEDTQLYLPEITEHLPLPQTAVIYLTTDAKVDLPSYLISSEVKILEMTIERSLVATSILEEQKRTENMGHQYENYGSLPLVDIPVTLDIELAIVRLAEVETDQLYSNTRELFEKFDPGKISYLNLKSSVTADAQTAFFSTIRPDQHRLGVELLRPANVFKSSSPTLSMKRLSSGSSQPALHSPMECANAEEVHHRLEQLENKAQDLLRKIGGVEGRVEGSEFSEETASMKTDLVNLKRDNESIRIMLTEMQIDNKRLSESTSRLANSIESFHYELQQLKSAGSYIQMHPAHLPSSPGSVKNGGGLGELPGGGKNKEMVSPQSGLEFESVNREFLQEMKCAQVLKLLETMGLTQYQESIQREQVTGEILSELDEASLENELGIKSKIHRVRLMKIVSGRHSAASIIKGDDPYYVPLAPRH